MHPNRAFVWDDEPAMRDFVERVAFALIAVAVDGRVVTAQAPLAFAGDGAPVFHLARANPLVGHLDGRPALATIVGEHSYISPDWYGSEDQVPTWNYRLVEIEGVVRRLDDAGLIDQLDRLSAAQEALLAPKPPWTRDKMNPARFAAMTKAIVGFAIDAPAIRGTVKLGQNKSAVEAAGAIAALRELDRTDIAASMETAR
ncbi:FMN-binding negative transcriptional regulator [Sphingomonas sp. BIUV-7]|uniref:FMN-binding negative transcriptional regulator n=1 Tax=Sphingomonas natans TaxID=3063330 RepID=A0ABT8YG79_9SPHN|nr:FMN-binding negative transcriptional regulator [Sphingomonas sp. BIUV-7]MDO6416909.1 FMN-binding negative transcriptional regulator [Sphingomonas sp. BIUV-7]